MSTTNLELLSVINFVTANNLSALNAKLLSVLKLNNCFCNMLTAKVELLSVLKLNNCFGKLLIVGV